MLIGIAYSRETPVLRDVLPYPSGNADPRFWGWVFGSGMFLGRSRQGRLVDAKQFEDIIIRAQPDASLLRAQLDALGWHSAARLQPLPHDIEHLYLTDAIESFVARSRSEIAGLNSLMRELTPAK